MKLTKKQIYNLIFLAIIAVLLIPQTRQPIQILLHKGLAQFSPSIIEDNERIVLNDYEWKLIDEYGNPYNFKEAKGKVVLLNFWATWCPPCIAEMPSMDELYKDYNDDVVFLFVSGESQKVISKFKTKHDYSFNVYSSLTKQPKVFETKSIPRTYILDKTGHVAIDKSGAANWNSDSVRQLLDNLLASE